MRVCIAQNRTLRLVLIVLRKSFVHPRMCRFVVGKHSLEPRVRGFMVDCTDRAGGPAFTHHKRTHSVFHAPIATLYHRVSLVRIWTNVLIHELKEAHRQLRETFPNLCSRSEEHTSELQSREISYAVFCLKKKKNKKNMKT